jgi:hypothetical protein
MTKGNPIVEAVGEEEFRWLSRTFDRRTALGDVPDRILERIASVDVTIRDYGVDPNALTAIALITFAYTMAERPQSARSGPKDILLVKALAKKERSRRQGLDVSANRLWKAPLFDLIMGEVGERVRAMATINSPL